MQCILAACAAPSSPRCRSSSRPSVPHRPAARRRSRRSRPSTAWSSPRSTLATHVGVDVLRRGGNAIDAAVAVGYALAVVYPAAGNLGGGGFMTIQLADGRKTFLDFREKAPLAATADMYLDAAGNVVKGASTNGHLAVGVPGTVAGLETARAKYGTHDARRADRAGDPRSPNAASCSRRATSTLLGTATERLPRGPRHRRDLPEARRALRAPATRWCRRTSPRTLRAISDDGPDGFYKGPVARPRSSRRAGPARGC